MPTPSPVERVGVRLNTKFIGIKEARLSILGI